MPNMPICCLICLPYIHEKVFVEIYEDCTLAQLKELLLRRFSFYIQPLYFYHFLEKRFLKEGLTLNQQSIQNGAIIYWI